MSSDKSFADEMAEKLGKKKYKEPVPSMSGELIFIFSKLGLITLISGIAYYSLALVRTLASGDDISEVPKNAAEITFGVFAITAIIAGLRGLMGGHLFIFESFRAVLFNRPRQVSSEKMMRITDLAFGIKFDTILFYGSAIIFLITYIFIL